MKVQCAHSVDPKTTTKKITPKISKPTPNHPNAIITTEPTEPEVLGLEPKTTRLSNYDNQTTNEDPSQKVNDDSTQSPPWWWRFTLKNQNNELDGRHITIFPPWFKEVEVNEFPAWIKKTVTASETDKKEDLIKRVRFTKNNQRNRQKLLESDKTLVHRNKVEKKLTSKDLVHGNDGMHSDQQREIQIPRHFTLPQQNRQSKYHAARQPGKLIQNTNTYSSKDGNDIFNLTASPRRPQFKSTIVKTERPNNVHDVVHILEPTTYPDYETTTVSHTHKRPLGNNTEIFIEIFEDAESKIKDESETESVPRLSPKVKFRINKQRTFMEKVRKQKNQQQFRFQPFNHNKDNKRWLPDDADSLHSHQSEYHGYNRIPNEYFENDPSEHDSDIIQHNKERKLADDDHERHDQNNINNFYALSEDTNSITTDTGDAGRTSNYIHFDTEVKQRFSEAHRPLPRLNILRHNMNRRQKGNLPDDLHDKNISTVATGNFENLNLLPDSGVTGIVDIFKPSTIHTSNLAKLFESKKTQLTVLEPTLSTWLPEKSQPSLPNSRFGHSLRISPSKKHIVLKPSPMLPHSFSAAFSTPELKFSTNDVNKSAKNKSK